MKKLLLLAFFAWMTTTIQAQLVDGSVAPNIKAVDINGRTWNLYDILESGRPVIMDVSATWCGPCWSYHNSNALETYFATHGPEGDGKSMVFFVEGDGSTNLSCLYGPTGCVGGTQGNWVANTPYPIFDNATVANDYAIAYFPTVYLICTDKTVREVGQLSASNLWTQASPCVGDIPANWGNISKFDPGARSLQICGKQTINPKFNFSNLGTDEITSMLVELRWNGTVVETVETTGTVKVLDEAVVEFSPMEITAKGTLTAEIVEVNGVPNGKPSVQVVEFVDPAPSYTGNKIEVRVRADNSAKDIYWALLDENSNILADGGNQLVGLNGGGQFPNGAPASPTAYANNASKRDTVEIPGECFTFVVVDAVGNGLLAPGNIKLHTLGGASFRGFTGNFGGRTGEAFTAITSGIDELSQLTALSIAPNPVAETMVVTYDLGISTQVNMSIVNAIGQTIFERNGAFATAGEQKSEISVAQFANGLYYLQLKAENGNVVAKPFVVAH